jgi:surfeit locus 1 family protein
LALRFIPRWYYTLLVLVAIPGFIALGFWQWHRGEYRAAQWAAFARADVPAVETTAAALERLPRFTRVRVTGEFDTRQLLLDNISHEGAAGYEVVSLLRLADGSHLMVDRGWVPFTGFRDRLPDVSLRATGPQIVVGRLSTLPVAGIAAGRLPPPEDGAWPRVTSFPSHAELQHTWGVPLHAPLLLLDADCGPGYLRAWRPPGIPPERNYSYAVQWWSFALLAAAMYVGLNLKKMT